MGVAVRDIGPAGANSFAPCGVIELVDWSQPDIASALPHVAAAHAGKVGLTAGLERKAAVEHVIPGIPFLNPPRVHRADEIAYAERRAHEDIVPDRIRNGDVRQEIDDTVVAVEQLVLIDSTILVGIDLLKRFRQHRFRRFFARDAAILVGIR